jgi:pimeloyl-ACP methyl ester carboxylesterase
MERSPATTESVRLPDGRTLAYREYGDPQGRAAVSCHGGLLCGRDAAVFAAAAGQLGVRILAPDRPGIGGSTAAPGRDTAGWAADVRALLDRLGIDRASVLGWSMGGQYALACAARLPERIDRAVVIAGALPLDDPAVFSELNAMDRRFTRRSSRHPRLARLSFAALGAVVRHAPKVWRRRMEKDAVPAETEALRALPDPGFAATAAVAFAHAAGLVEEYRAWARPWGFTPEDVQAPTVVWQGDADALVPPHWAETLSARIPGAALRWCPGEGHFLALRHQEEILRDLVGG